MKKQGHPPYQKVLFVDSSTGFKFVCGTTLNSKEKEEFEGQEYPVIRMSTSSASHPFWTKSNQFVDSEGRVDKFMKKYKRAPKVEEKKEGEGEPKKEAKEAAPKKKAAPKKTQK
jgi:large subunit ribosomal protein L31